LQRLANSVHGGKKEKRKEKKKKKNKKKKKKQKKNGEKEKNPSSIHMSNTLFGIPCNKAKLNALTRFSIRCMLWEDHGTMGHGD
jgi:hypothetical protein